MINREMRGDPERPSGHFFHWLKRIFVGESWTRTALYVLLGFALHAILAAVW